MTITISLIILGIFSGVISGMTGASGVMLVIPVLVIIFDFSPYIAIGISLLADVISSIPIALVYASHHEVKIQASLLIIIGALVGAQIGAHEVNLIQGDFLTGALLIFMIGLGIKMVRTQNQEKIIDDQSLLAKIFLSVRNHRLRHIFSLGIGIILGIFAGLFGAGGGIIVFLVLYYILGLSLRESIGTAAFVMLMTAFSGMIGYIQKENIDISVGLIIGISAAFGGWISSVIAHKISEKQLHILFGFILIVASLFLGMVYFFKQ